MPTHIPEILKDANQYVFKPLGFKLENILTDLDSKPYFGHVFQCNNRNIIFRKAKITPKKIGQFVAIWKRDHTGLTAPYDFLDAFDFIVIQVKRENNLGQFVFPKSILIENGIVSTNQKEGKRGIRVYPIWDKPISKQAVKTQNWQLRYFLEISANTDLEVAKKLYA